MEIKNHTMALENEILEELKKIREAVTPKDESPPAKGMLQEFKEFIGKAGVLGLAIGFIMGTAIGKVVTSLVQDLIMPIPGAFVPGGDWRKAIFNIPLGSGLNFGIGDFVGAIIDFSIITVVIFFIARFAKKARLK